MLHITDGDSAGGTIPLTGIPGDVLPWRDVLHEGPVPAGLSLDQLRVVRARFLADCGWTAFDQALRELSERDRVLTQSLAHDEVVLWFEHDLYDQLQLLQVLDWYAGQDLGSTRLSLLCAAEYLGPATPERLRERFPDRLAVSASQLELGRNAWAAFRAPDPTAITDLLEHDTSALPFLRDALHRHLQQFPSTRNGLSRSESQALEAVAGGATRMGQAYLASHHQREEAIFLGDIVFGLYVEGLSQGPEPLVLHKDGGRIVAPRDPADARAFWDTEVCLTEAGRAVLEGRADRIALEGIDRWLGGVHLAGSGPHWRWDEAGQRLTRKGV
jgi:hypothetical protein